MNFDKPLVEKNIPQKETLDDKWYEKFEKLGAFQDYEYLSGNKEIRNIEKQKFLTGEVENPTLDYPELEKFDFAEKEKGLLELKNTIIENEPNGKGRT